MNLKRAVSNKFGLNRRHDAMPEICLRPLDEGSTAGIRPDMEVMLRDYYRYRGWDWETGRPTKEKLRDLGLTQVAREMYPWP